jgi:DNA-binding response OmpR family regulator
MNQIRNILIIDPIRDSRIPLKKKLSRHGYSTLAACTPGEGLELIIEKKPDLVLLNFSCRGEPELEILKEILRAVPNITVIVIGGHSDDSLALECMRAGAADYLKFPLVFDPLIRSINRIQEREYCLSIFSKPDTECVIIEDKTIIHGNNPEKIPYIVNQAVLNAGAVCQDIELLKMALGEIILNAVEHGNLNISMSEKAEAVNNGTYYELLDQRRTDPRYASRVVTLKVHMEPDAIIYHVIDEGDGFDYRKKFDPDPRTHIGSGLGMEIAKNFFSEVSYKGRGNRVKLVYRRR